ncbi:MAG: hypothetical protein EBT44_00400 [Actinobacteria bacterium]|uniref:Uncharacterized protein n=1 Tax=Candidatus Fonsibacter lacus TaxID=2576439 RepID=A0A965GCS6_9PROT|nr:hypothetical protein [Candidatus Fonsibacter lacus]
MELVPYTRTTTRSLEKSFQEAGSTIPLILGIFIVALSTLIVTLNIYYLHTAKLELEAVGEDFLSELYQEIDYDKYFFGDVKEFTSQSRNWVPFDCSNIIEQARINSNYLPGKISLKSITCDGGRVSLIFVWQVKLPYQPGFLDGFEPKVIASISGGVQRVPGD